jgi:uncharacterized protein YndB with AHSA1/START domain
MSEHLIARATIIIDAPVRKVWEALTNPDDIRQYMFSAQVITDWREGSSIIWKGEWQGTTYEDKGEILQLVPIQLIQYSHYSPLSGVPDTPENYHVVTVELSYDGKSTHVLLVQDNNANEEERQHSQKNWEMMLENLKKHLEVSSS